MTTREQEVTGDAAGAARAGASLREVEPASAVSSQAAIPIAEILARLEATEEVYRRPDWADRFSFADMILWVEEARAVWGRDRQALRDLCFALSPPKEREKIAWPDLRVGAIYQRRDGRLVQIVSLDGGKWGNVRYANLNRAGRVPPMGKKSASYFCGELVRALSPDASGIVSPEGIETPQAAQPEAEGGGQEPDGAQAPGRHDLAAALDEITLAHDEAQSRLSQSRARIAELEAALRDTTEYLRIFVRETTDPGTGSLCALYNAEKALPPSWGDARLSKGAP